jgi:hypothetical protein
MFYFCCIINLKFLSIYSFFYVFIEWLKVIFKVIFLLFLILLFLFDFKRIILRIKKQFFNKYK